MAKFERGTTVKLNSGGPLMTVETTDEGYALCHWFDGKNEPQEKSFHEDLLKEDDGSITFY
jgi:uncharacterized protein YodC (DUF2158 family)